MKHVMINGEVIILNYIKRISEPKVDVWLPVANKYIPINNYPQEIHWYRGFFTLYLIDKTEHFLIYDKIGKVDELGVKYWEIVERYRKNLVEDKMDESEIYPKMNAELLGVVEEMKRVLMASVSYQRDRIVNSLKDLSPVEELGYGVSTVGDEITFNKSEE